jgi:hypothetical protein
MLIDKEELCSQLKKVYVYVVGQSLNGFWAKTNTPNPGQNKF